MRKILLLLTTAALCAFFSACGNQPTSNTAANANANAKPANAANSAASAPAGDTAAAEAEIGKLMDAGAVALAKNDADAMEKIYADDYVLVNLDGTVQTKSERLASLRSGDAKYTAFSYSEPKIR